MSAVSPQTLPAAMVGEERGVLRLRFMTGSKQVAILDVASSQELARKLHAVFPELAEAPEAVSQVHVHLRYHDAWWSLTHDLAEFAAWIIEAKGVSFQATRRFAELPLSRPDWLFEAAQQLVRLLNATKSMLDHV